MRASWAAVRRWEKLILVGLVVVAIGGYELYHRLGADPAAADAGASCAVDDGGGRLRQADCDRTHDWEIVRSFTDGATAERCRAEVDAFLGGRADEARVVSAFLDYEVSKTKLRACAVAEAVDTDGTGARIAGTLRAGMRDRRLAVTCIGPVQDGNAEYRDCALPHAAELAAVLEAGAGGCAGPAFPRESGRTLCFKPSA